MNLATLLALACLGAWLPFQGAHGQIVGLVCLAPTSVSQCPAPPVNIGGIVGGQLRVSVILQGSDSINGFDITLSANSSILKPAGADVTGSLLSGGTVLVKCFGGVLKQGTVCSPTDTIDTIHLAMAGPIGFLTIFPSNGLLFTAVYNVTSPTSTSIGFQTSCSQSSVAGTSLCVSLSNGTILPVSETTQTAAYTQAPTPTFVLSVDFADVTVVKKASTNITITVLSVNGLSGQVSLSTSIAPSAKHPPNLALSPSSLTLAPGAIATSVLNIREPPNMSTGTYFVTVTANSGTVTGSIQIRLLAIP